MTVAVTLIGTTPSHSVPIGESDDLILRFQIRSRRSIADKLVGEVRVPLRDLIESASGGKTPAPANFVSYQVKKPSGRLKGVLTFSYRFNGNISGAAAAEEPVVNVNHPLKPQPTSTVYPASAPVDLYPPPVKPEPVTGYPAVDVYPTPAAAAAMQTTYGYPTQGDYGYGYPTQMGYGYSDQAGYGYGPYGNGYGCEYGGQVMQPSRKKSGGLGLGAGLLGGAMAGLFIGDLVSDVCIDR